MTKIPLCLCALRTASQHMDAYIGWLGSTHVAHVLANSDMFDKAEASCLTNQEIFVGKMFCCFFGD